MLEARHTYEVRPRKDHRGVDLISDVLPFGRLWYDGGKLNQQRQMVVAQSDRLEK